jgi:phosphatidylethanolamine-binding protein (PEBP) family uncharacterized protein
MARSIDPLVVGRVVGDVIDMFVPSVDLAVQYTSRQVSNGCQMKPSATALAPNIEVADHNADNANLFTLIMTDPDAPSPSEPSMREWVHWIVTDIPGSNVDTSQGILYQQAESRFFMLIGVINYRKYSMSCWHCLIPFIYG